MRYLVSVFTHLGMPFSLSAKNFTAKTKIKKTALYILLFAASVIISCDDGGGSGSEASIPLIPPVNTLPSVPGQAIVMPGDSQLNLSWTEVDEFTSYEVWYSTENDSSTSSQAGGVITDTFYIITNLINDTPYYMWLKSKNSHGTSGFGPVASGTPEAEDFYVYYNAGSGNSGGTVPSDTTAYHQGETATVLGNTGSLIGEVIRDGIKQRFIEWNTLENGSGTAYSQDDIFTITENTTLYAIYTTGTDVMRKVGPAGGWIFYDAGSIQVWGRYLESANADLPNSLWGFSGTNLLGADGILIGTGEQNSADIQMRDSTSNKAADRCGNYSVVYSAVTYNDWFLPSRDELNAIYVNLYLYGVGNFQNNGSYQSSSEYNAYTKWCHNFVSNDQTNSSKSNFGYVRAVRAF